MMPPVQSSLPGRPGGEGETVPPATHGRRP